MRPPAAETTGPAAVTASAPSANHLLAMLPGAELQLLRPQLELVTLPLGQVLYESGVALSHAYFPTSAIVSLLYLTEDGGSSEIATVGPEGMVGTPIFMGGGSTPSRAVVRSTGTAFRISAVALQAAFAGSAVVMRVLLRYTQALIAQLAQIAVCNRHHALEQQLCRWLLLTLDRLPGPAIEVTQQMIAHALGVRREGVTEAALSLQHAGIIRYQRGHMAVLDRDQLEHRSCECYAVIKAEYDRLIP